ncbi:MAG: hypothetical protein AB8B91_16520 [Rubripirellula sp.]
MIEDSKPLEELQVSSDICEEAGFTDEAQFLQAISNQTCKVFVIVERGFEYNDEVFHLNDEAAPQKVFLDKTSALRAAEQQNAGQLRQYNPLAFCYGIEEISSLSQEQIQARVREILNDRTFQIDEEESWELEPIFPSSTTDDQMREIYRLFDKLQFFEVVESDLSL